MIDYREYAPRGFALASRDEIRHAGFEDRVVGTRDGVAWAAEFAWFNARYYGGPQEGQSMTPTPDRSRSRRAKAARWLVGVAVGAAGELAVPAAAFVALIALLKCLR